MTPACQARPKSRSWLRAHRRPVKLESHHFGIAGPYDPVMLRRVRPTPRPNCEGWLEEPRTDSNGEMRPSGNVRRVGSCRKKPGTDSDDEMQRLTLCSPRGPLDADVTPLCYKALKHFRATGQKYLLSRISTHTTAMYLENTD